MAQQLKALVALAEDLGLVPSTYMIVHVIHKLEFWKSGALFRIPQAPGMHMVYVLHIQAKHIRD